MTEQTTISLFVKLGYWDVYRLNAVLTATVFRKVLYFWGLAAFLMARIICLFGDSSLVSTRLGRHHAECEPAEMGVFATRCICVCPAAALRATSAEG